jgi:uncharacterized membrane protein YkoI
MKTKFALVLSVFVTVIILAVVGGVLVAAKNPAAAATTQVVTAMDPTREAQYQALIAQANQTIAEANQKIAQLSANQAVAVASATPYPVSADQASAIASNASGETAVALPELVNYSGTVAYSVSFADGLVYVNANTGEVLYNGVQVTQIISKDQASQIAINYTGDSRVVEVISGSYNNAAAYRVTFSNGEQVYIDLYGNILAVQLPAYTSSSSGGGEHEEEDD